MNHDEFEQLADQAFEGRVGEVMDVGGQLAARDRGADAGLRCRRPRSAPDAGQPSTGKQRHGRHEVEQAALHPVLEKVAGVPHSGQRPGVARRS